MISFNWFLAITSNFVVIFINSLFCCSSCISKRLSMSRISFNWSMQLAFKCSDKASKLWSWLFRCFDIARKFAAFTAISAIPIAVWRAGKYFPIPAFWKKSSPNDDSKSRFSEDCNSSFFIKRRKSCFFFSSTPVSSHSFCSAGSLSIWHFSNKRYACLPFRRTISA